MSYTNTFEESKCKSISIGEYYDSTLSNELLDNKIKVIQEEYIDYNMTFFSYCNVFMLTDDYRICNNIEIGEGEAVISDYVASNLGISSEPIGKKITVGSQEYTVIGCIEGVENPELANKFNLYDEQQELYESYYLDNYFNVVFINESDVLTDKRRNNKYITTECADILNYKYERYYTKTVTISSTKLLGGQELLYGEYPDEPNEILISANYALDNGLMSESGELSDGLFNMEFEFKDIHSEYNNFFSDTLNMKDYFDCKVRITGVYSDYEHEVEYMIHDEVYQKMLEDYCTTYIYDRSILYIEPSDYKDILTHIKMYQSEINEPSISEIYYFESMINSIKNAIIFLLIVLIVIAIFMIYHNTYISISYNRKTIGILRSIGVSKRCTMKIFLVEAIVICSLSCTLATAFGGIVMNVVNKIVREGVKINPYDVVLWDWPVSLLIILVAFVVFMFTAAIPIYIYGKKTPIKAIRNN